MLDISIWEMGVIAVVALLVFGPNRLPEIAKKTGKFLANAQAKWRHIKTEIDQMSDPDAPTTKSPPDKSKDSS